MKRDSEVRRFLSWAASLAIVTGLGGVAMAASEDTFIPIQDPPTIEITPSPLYQSFDGTNFEAVDRILPSASSSVTRRGFTGNADANAIDSDVAFSYTSSDQIERVAPDQSLTSAPVYRQTIQVTTNGPTSTIQRVGYCLINTSDTVVRATDSVFEWYDSGTGGVMTNDVERNCGFNDDNPTAVATPDSGSERAVISLVYDAVNNTFSIEGNSFHDVISGNGDATWSGQTLTVDFKFRPSHELMKQVSGWAVRAAAQDQPTEVVNGDPGDTTFDPQMSQIFWGMDADMEGEVTSDETSRAEWNFASVGYYGAIMSERQSVSFGTLRKDESRTVTAITTGRYIANATSKLWMEASDFLAQGAGTEQLAYVDAGSPGSAEVAYECSYQAGDANLGSGSVYVTNTPVELKSDLGMTTDASTPGDSQDINGSGMSCRLTYGGGASDASEVFKNQVVLSIQDAGSAVQPFNQ